MAPAAVGATCLSPGAGQEMQAANTSDAPVQFSAALAIRPAKITVGAPFAVGVEVCSETGAAIERIVIDATMPAHRHGMNYRPEVVTVGDGRYEARGFVFHMPGHWEITLSVYSDGPPTHLTLATEVQ